MPGFLLEDDAITARKNVFDDWLEEQKRNAASAAQAAQQTAQAAVQSTADEVAQRRQAFDSWLATQNAPPAAPQAPQPTLLAPPSIQASADIAAPASPEAQQRASAFDDWLTQRGQDVANVTQAVQGAVAPPAAGPAPAASLPHTEEPATQADHLGERWKTQFDFGAIYNGDYRTGTPHRGVDMVPSGGGGIGTEVDAFAPGTVTNISRDSGAGGLMVYVQDANGLTHAYMHLANVAPGLKVGQTVSRGDPIAQMGESGTEGSPHLHYEVRKNAATGDPLDKLIDPRPYVRGEGQQSSAQSQQTSSRVPQGTTRTTAELSGGGPAQGLNERATAIMDDGQRAAVWLGGEGQKALQAVLVTEGGMNNARGDGGASAGPLQFFGEEGGRAGQLNALARDLGSSLADARRWAEENPGKAVQWAIGTAQNPGYLGKAIMDGIRQGLRGPDLATFAQAHGQVSVSPERAGQNWQALFGQGQEVVASTLQNAATTARRGLDDTIGQGAQAVAARAQQMADDSGRLVQQSQQGMQDALTQLDQARARIAADNERSDTLQRDQRNRQLGDLMQPRQFDLSLAQNQASGFQAPSSSLSDLDRNVWQAGHAVGGAFDQLGRTAGSWFQEDPYIQQQRDLAQTPEGRRQQLAGTAGVTPDQVATDPARLGTAGLIRAGQSQLEQEADLKTGQALAEAVIRKAKDAGWTPEPEQEQVARTALSTVTPMNVLLTIATGPEGIGAKGLAEAAAFVGLSALGAGAGEAAAPHLPEEARPFAPLIGSFVAPVAGSLGVAGARGALAKPAQGGRAGVRDVLRNESGALDQLPEDVGAAAGREADAGFTSPGAEPPRRGMRDFLTGEGSEEGSIDPRLGLRLGGAAAGGVAGAMTTSDQDDPFARFAKIGGGALAGAYGPGFIHAAITAKRPTGAELEALRPRAPVQGPAPGRSLAEGLVTYGKGNMLSGITTHLSNIISQSVELARQPLLRTVSGYEDEAADGVRAAAEMLPTALQRFGEALRTGRSIYADRPSGSTAHPFLRLLMGTDDFFKTVGEGMGRGMEARRVLNENGNPKTPAQISAAIQGNVDRIVEGGTKASNLTVFGEGANTGLGQWLSQQKQQLLASNSPKDKTLGMLFDALVPFSSVPDKLWTAGIMRAPGVNEVAQFAKAGYHIAGGDARGARAALAEMAVGSVINSAILTQVANGNVTGPDDPEHPSSIRINGTWVDYSGWGPYALPIALPAAIMESVQKTRNTPDAGTMEYAGAMSKAMTKTLLDASYLSSFLRLAGQLGRGDLPGALGTAGGSNLDRYVPVSSLLNQVEQSFDRNMREVDAAKPWEREAARIPGLAGFLPHKISPTTGEPVVRPRGSVLGTLFRADTEETDPLKHQLAELDRQGYALPALKDYPDTVSWHGTEIKLRPEEQRAVTAQLGKARAELAAEIASAGWQRSTADEKALFLSKQLARIASMKTQAWLDTVDPADAEKRLAAAERVGGRLVGGRT